MKIGIIIAAMFILSQGVRGQNLQLHYDLRHSVDPKNTVKNFPFLYFEYWKGRDSGSFLLKMQADLFGERGNMGQFYMQVSQTFRWWKPKVYLQVQYSGGLGISEPGKYPYVITNSFAIGGARPFQGGSHAFYNFYACYKLSGFSKPSHDPLAAFYWLLFSKNYKINFSGNIVTWTENKNHGDDFTANESGKRFFVFADPQIWFTVYKGLSLGSRCTVNYHVLSADNAVKIYPSVGVRYQL